MTRKPDPKVTAPPAVQVQDGYGLAGVLGPLLVLAGGLALVALLALAALR